MTVLSIAFPFAPVGPDAVGGAEQILSLLDRALVRSGHRSIVIACEGSSTEGLLIPAGSSTGRMDDAIRGATHARYREAIRRVLDELPVDLVHMHGVDFCSYLPDSGVPVLVTLHLPPSLYAAEAFRLERERTYLQCVSWSQRNGCPAGAQPICVIENGVPVDRLQPLEKTFGYAVALGRICPEKGFHLAAVAAGKAKTPLLIGGAVCGYDEHARYFRELLQPLLENRACRYIGQVAFRHKRLLLAGARCLVAPSLVPETSSLVAMESLACGTPVVAFRSGALTEIVEDGRTGFLVEDVEGMAEAIQDASKLDREACRDAALRRFSADRMTREYLDLYGRILN